MPNDRQPNPLLERLGALLQAALNRALALDPATRAQLAALEGRRIGVQLRGTDLALAVTVAGGELRVGPHWSAPSDLNLDATPGSLFAFALRNDTLPPGKVAISGDAELARRVEQLLRGYAPDVEEAFAKVFGDVAGVAFAQGVKRAAAWARDSALAFARDSADYLSEESRDVVAPAEMDEFLDDVDALRERAERLEARVERLRKRST